MIRKESWSISLFVSICICEGNEMLVSFIFTFDPREIFM